MSVQILACMLGLVVIAAVPVRAEIVDAAHGGSPGFYWLAPVVFHPVYIGTFDAAAAPTLIVERISPAQGVIATFPAIANTSFGDGFFYAAFDTRPLNLTAKAQYRMVVVKDGLAIGYADWDVVNGLGQVTKVDRTNYVAVVKDAPFAVSFRIERTVAPCGDNDPPVVSAGGNLSFFIGESVRLTATATDPDASCGDSLSYSWDLNGDGTFGDRTGNELLLSPADLAPLGFARPDPLRCDVPNTTIARTVAVRVTDSRGAFAAASFGLTGRVNEPVACPDVPSQITTSCVSPSAALLRSSGSYHGAAPQHQSVSWDWDVDYTESAGFQADVTAPHGSDVTSGPLMSLGSFTIALRVTDDNSPAKSVIATRSLIVVAANTPPVASPSPRQEGGGFVYDVEDGPLTLDASLSSDPDACLQDFITRYQWDLNNDGIFSNAIIDPPGVVTDVNGLLPDVVTTSPFLQIRSDGWTPGLDHAIRLRVRDSGLGGSPLDSAPVSALIRVH